MSVSYRRVAAFWDTADILAILWVMFHCVFVTFPYCVLSWEWYLIISIPDICLSLLSVKSKHLKFGE